MLPDDLITVPEAAEQLMHGVHRATIRRWILRGKLRAWRIGKRYLVSKKDLMAMVEPYSPPKPPPNMPVNKRDNDKFKRWSDEVLKAKGLK